MPDSCFKRGAERIHCEHRQNGTGYQLTMSTPGGGFITQSFSDLTSLMQRRSALERLLLAAGWVPEPEAR